MVRGAGCRFSPGEPWDRRTIYSGPLGADGVSALDIDGNGLLDSAAPWEQSHVLTVSIHPGYKYARTTPWPTVTVAALAGAEDAVLADVDGDGAVDVIGAGQSDRRIRISFGPAVVGLSVSAKRTTLMTQAAWTIVDVAAATNLQAWMQVALADMDGDGRADIVAGGRNYPSSIGYFKAPVNRRDGAAWTWVQASDAAWTMSLIPMDVDDDEDLDLVVSDRTYYDPPPPGERVFSLRGARWLENSDGAGLTWVNHPINNAAGTHKFITVVDIDGDGDEDVLGGQSDTAGSALQINRNDGAWLTWTPVTIPTPSNTGQFQGFAVGDIDDDGIQDLVVTHAAADGPLSGVVWLRGPTWERWEVSGPDGTKYDNAILDDVDGDGDLDIRTNEQIEQLGDIWYINPRLCR